MSLAELTRNCFQSGISSQKWLRLCQLFLSKGPTIYGIETAEGDLSNSVLSLYRSYPGDPGLQEYLKHALQKGGVSLPTFIVTMLQASRSPELHNAATLDTLCRIALDAHYSSGLPPIGSVTPYGQSSIVVLSTIQDSLALLRTAHSLPASHFHQLTTSASELVMLLLSCVSDISQVSTAQAMMHFADANDILHTFPLKPELRPLLETFVMTLSIMLGDDAKAAREAQMMHSIQMALSKGDILGQSSDTDIITMGLVFQHMINNRGHDFGAGSSSNAVALLVAAFRWSSWTPAVFYTQLLSSAWVCVSQSFAETMLWRAFLVGRLPQLLVSFTDTVKADNTTTVEWRSAMQTALSSLRDDTVISSCEHLLSRSPPFNTAAEEGISRPFFREFVQHIIDSKLVDPAFGEQLDLPSSKVTASRLQSEAQDLGYELSSFIELKLAPDVSLEDGGTLIDRIWREVGTQAAFATAVFKRFSAVVNSLDAESLSHICKILYSYPVALDIIALHVKMEDIIFFSLLFLEQYDCETVGDPQTAFSHLGDVVLFVQYCIGFFQFERKIFTKDGRSLSSAYLSSTTTVYNIETLSPEELACFTAWFKAIFDSSSEGIEDTILRTTQPKMLLRMSSTLFSQAIQAVSARKIDADVLGNGVSYFTGSLLNWTIVGVIKTLVRELEQKPSMPAIHLQILHTLILSASCPRPVLALCSAPLLALSADRLGKPPSSTVSDIAEIRRVVTESINSKSMSSIHSTGQSTGHAVTVPWQEQPRQLIQQAFAMARAQKVPVFDMERCLKISPPTKFLQVLWSELLVSSSLGETEICKRIATFVLTMPRSSKVPPLLPIFVHIVLPSIISAMDHQSLTEHELTVELIVTVISSVLTGALHLEWAMRSISGEHRSVLGETSAGMARRLLVELRSRTHSWASKVIMQRLASSQSFVANFPIFMN
ncbi:mediator complex subunit Med5-domain-containing protein [Crucibulum laeve]|uniref:Mediator of RNA polymerase II transcription subunit 5 n=1 Tax=Crucibulum laeve TaxID=68775 RepID=A0A5C3M9F9_9AGAR|nr:mediator complex subunit Med5-domain-containing protein [Crucibulum laeve]